MMYTKYLRLFSLLCILLLALELGPFPVQAMSNVDENVTEHNAEEVERESTNAEAEKEASDHSSTEVMDDVQQPVADRVSSVKSPRSSINFVGNPNVLGGYITIEGEEFQVLKDLGNGNRLIVRKHVLPRSVFRESGDYVSYHGSKLEEINKNYYASLSPAFQAIVQPVSDNFSTAEVGIGDTEASHLTTVVPGGTKTAFALSVADVNTSKGAWPTLTHQIGRTPSGVAEHWWLRSKPYALADFANIVHEYGNVEWREVTNTEVAVRPALIIHVDERPIDVGYFAAFGGSIEGGTVSIKKTHPAKNGFEFPKTVPNIGYRFSRWSVSYTGGAELTASSVVGDIFPDGAADNRVHAQFLANSYNIHFEGHGASSGVPADRTVLANQEIPMRSLSIPKREGYLFNGWWTKNAGGTDIGILLSPTPIAIMQELSQVLGHNETITLHARWKIDPESLVHVTIPKEMVFFSPAGTEGVRPGVNPVASRGKYTIKNHGKEKLSVSFDTNDGDFTSAANVDFLVNAPSTALARDAMVLNLELGGKVIPLGRKGEVDSAWAVELDEGMEVEAGLTGTYYSTNEAKIKTVASQLKLNFRVMVDEEVVIGGDEWVKLTEDANGNSLLVAKRLQGNSIFNASGGSNIYKGSHLEQKMKDFYDGLDPDIKNKVQPVILPTHTTWTDIATNQVGELSYVGGTEKTAFALSYSEVDAYLGWPITVSTGLNPFPFENNSVNPIWSTWWLRSRASTIHNAADVSMRDDLSEVRIGTNGRGVSSQSGVRPAIWVKLD